jgi:hypothetical protein
MSDASPGFVERALTYGALSYAFGFLVVMLHTARLGFPVIALLDPIYVWIGFPLAVVAFFAAQIWAAARQNIFAAREGLRAAIRNIRPAEGKPLAESFGGLAVSFANAFPILPFGSGLTVHAYLKLFAWLATLAAKTDEYAQAIQRASAYLNSFLMALSGALRFLNTVTYVGVLGILLWAYVWHLYPKIPKAYGGGAPTTVRLVLSDEALPKVLLSDLGAQSNTLASDTGGSVQTDTLTLLYSTSDAYYIRTHSRRIISVSAGVVDAIIWP